MSDRFGLRPPGPDASLDAFRAYQQAYNDRAMAEERSRLDTLYAELLAKVNQADGERAFAAFTQVLHAAGVDAWDAAQAQFKLECWDNQGFQEDGGLSELEGVWADAWRDAVEAGRVELCDKAPFVSEAAFGLVDFLERDASHDSEHMFSVRPKVEGVAR